MCAMGLLSVGCLYVLFVRFVGCLVGVGSVVVSGFVLESLVLFWGTGLIC